MLSTITRPTFSVGVVFAASVDEAVAKVTGYLERGRTGRVDVGEFRCTGRGEVRSARHMIVDVEVEDLGGDRDALWVFLTSYGMSPGPDLGSVWQQVPGVGKIDD